MTIKTKLTWFQQNATRNTHNEQKSLPISEEQSDKNTRKTLTITREKGRKNETHLYMPRHN